LLTARLLRNRLGMPIGQIADRMTELSASEAGDGYYLVNRTQHWDQIDQAPRIDTNKKWVTITDLRSWRHQFAPALHADPLPT
jgi:hypothetical protein